MRKRTQQKPTIYGLIAAGLFGGLLLLGWKGHALTESGTLILNQSSATFVDNNGVVQDVISNQVETVIRQVAGLDLVSSQSKPGFPNGQVFFPHVLTNTGNGSDTYELCIANEVGSFSFDSISVFPDEDEDGLPDSSTAIADQDFDGCLDIGPLSSGESYSFVVVAETPDVTASNQVNQFDVEATSDFDLSLSASNTDEVTLVDGPLIEVVKTLSDYTGYAGTGGYSVTLEYRNVGSETATNLMIRDILPAQANDGSTGDLSLGMVYTPGSAAWQQGTALDLQDNLIDPLTENDDINPQAGGGTVAANVIYCAYDVACDAAGFGDIDFDENQVTIQIDSVPVGDIGSLTFSFSVDDGYDDDAILTNFASFEYQDAASLVTLGTYESNTVSFVITEEVEFPAVVANNSDSDIATGVVDSVSTGNVVSVASVAQTEAVLFSNYIWNDAPAGIDTFDITIDALNDREGNPLTNAFPIDTSFTLLKEDGQTPLLDTNGNGIPDTGPVDSGEYVEVILRAQLPLDTFGNNGGVGWAVTKIATSITDSNVTNAVTDNLLSIASATVDLTNDSAGTQGAGIGPEGSPVTTLSIAPGQSDVFQLWVENTSAQPDAYLLDYSDQNPFITGSLPADWTVAITADAGNLDCSTVSSTAQTSAFVVLPAEKALFCATVTIGELASATSGPVDIFFRVRSESTGALDIKTDAVSIPSQPALDIETNMTGQMEPGGTIAYPHIITNTGNEPLECVNVSLTDTRVAEGWTSTAYLDVDGDGNLTGADSLLTDQTLAIGAELRILINIFAPTTEPLSVINITDVQAEGYADDGVAGCSGTLLTDSVEDATTTTNTDMVINKNQALDADCDGIADGAPSNTDPSAPFALTSFTVLPEQCVVYRLVATNQGVSILYNAEIRDVVPGFTTYVADAQACVSQDADPCTFNNPPAAGSSRGLINVTSAQLLPGGTVTVFFGIKVD